MKYLGITIVGILGAIAGGAIFAASQLPYQAERIVKTQSSLMCGAGYYNEGLLTLAGTCIIAACVMTVIALDYLRIAAREGRSS